MKNLRRRLSVGMAATTLAVVLAYMLGGQELLQSPYAEPAHNFFMSLKNGISGMASPMHGIDGSAVQSPSHGIIGNNALGGPVTLPAGGLAAVVIFSVIPLSAAAFVLSWNKRSFVVAGLLAISGLLLMIPPLIATGYLTIIVMPGPILGFITGLGILVLGVTNGIRTASAIIIISR